MCIALKRELWNKGIDIANNTLEVMQQRAYDVLNYFNISDFPEGGIPIVGLMKDVGIKVFKDDRIIYNEGF